MMSWTGRYQTTLSVRFYSYKVLGWYSSYLGLDGCPVGLQGSH